MLDLLKTFVTRRRSAFSKTPLLFLATDTSYLIPTISNATRSFGMDTVVLPQIRVEDNAGVTFSALKGQDEKCLLGWRAMMSDMILLSSADILLAARHSSFTQSLPLSLLFEQKKHLSPIDQKDSFCEMSSNATRMTCFDDMRTWLFREEDSGRMRNYALDIDNEPDSRVHHKLLVQFEDVEPAKDLAGALEFLRNPQGKGPDGGAPYESHTFGSKRYYQKYRKRKQTQVAASWNFIS
jgi:hypothetical protein